MKQIPALLLGFLTLLSARCLFAAQPPNILYIISDDQAWTDYGFMGHKTIRTPRLDRLAAESATFPRGYVPDSLCRPSLATLITGLYPHQHKISGNDPVVTPLPKVRKYDNPQYRKLNEQLIRHIEEHPTLPRLLAKKGYLSLQTGKWWEGHYSRGGFTHGMTHGDPDRGGRHGDLGLQIGRQGLKPCFEFIDQAGEKPWFLWYAPFLPHSPHTPPKRLLEKYQAPGKSIHVARYQAMCEWFDETCGELLDYIDQAGLRDNTLVIYVTDNGWIQREDSRRYAPKSKRSQYDGGVRTPILLRWPGQIKPARYEKTLVHSIDLAPTILAAAGIDPPEQMPGINLLEVCRNNGCTERNAIFGEIFAHDIADVNRPAASLIYRWVISGNDKLIVPVDPSLPIELYDLGQDPWETKNLAAQRQQRVTALRRQLDAWWPGK